MKAMVLKEIVDLTKNRSPLSLEKVEDPFPKEKEVLIEVSTCGVCHTELDEIEGRTPPPHFPVIPGHQIVGTVIETGKGCNRIKTGDRVGVAWIHTACETCEHCLSGNENLCDHFKATGRDVSGGYAELTTVPEGFAYRIPDVFSDLEAAPLLCAGAIGYRSLRLSNIKNGHCLGLTGFGASAHLVLKMVRYQFPKSRVYVFARSEKERQFALEIGAVWAGDTADDPPESLHAIIDTTPAWKPVIEALKHLQKGGRLVINAIRKEDFDKDCLLQLDYPVHLWMEKEIKSVANVARNDVSEFLKLAARIPIIPHVQSFPLASANDALLELKERKIKGAKVLVME
jgi:propanol-preferring alcohol dehydrogenase